LFYLYVRMTIINHFHFHSNTAEPVSSTLPTTAENRNVDQFITSIFRNITSNNPSDHGTINVEMEVDDIAPVSTTTTTTANLFVHLNRNTAIRVIPVEYDENDSCTICCQGFYEKQIIRELLHCKHFFHIQCVDKWFETHITCPICRVSLVPYHQVPNQI